MYILGISSFYHDSAACLIKDGEIIAAVQEERFTRIKHDPSFPSNAIKFCLSQAKIDSSEISNIVFYEKPLIKFERLLETYLAFAPKGFVSFCKAIPIWVKEKLFQKSLIKKNLNEILGNEIDWSKKLLFSEHHLSHASSAFYPSPFEKAAILTLDGVGEWTTTSIAYGERNKIKILKEIYFPHSLGLLYSAFTYYTGFKVNSGEYKLMGLAPYGRPIYTDKIKNNLIKIENDGSFHLNMKFFNFATGLTMTNNKFNKLFGGLPRKSETEITQREMDIAASVQKVTEEVIIKIARYAKKITDNDNLCLAGGVALNCVANGILLREKVFKNIWIQPAAGDAGGALGAALSVWYLHYKKNRLEINKFDKMKGSYLGPHYENIEIEKELKSKGAIFKKYDDREIIERVAKALDEKKAIGWMQGRMEFGPRALGARSIIADPRSPLMQKQLNLKVKYRESFRPFAPSVLIEHVNNWFEQNEESPYMLLVSNLNKDKLIEMTESQKKLFGIEKLNVPRSVVPAITHVDNSARIQTVHKETNPMYHALISKFFELSGCPMIVNTSFNIRGEPIVCTPSDAYRCFMGTDLDLLNIGNYILYKDDQPDDLKNKYQDLYGLD